MAPAIYDFPLGKIIKGGIYSHLSFFELRTTANLALRYTPHTMSSAWNKRHTQIDFNTFGGLKRQIADINGVGGKNATPKRDRTKALGRKRLDTLDEETTNPETGLRDLTLVEAAKSGVGVHKYIRTKSSSPWEDYEKCWDLRLGVKDWITVAERRGAQSNAVAVKRRSNDPLSKLVLGKRFEWPSFEENVRKLQQVQHTNIRSALEVFRFERTSYVVFEYMAYSVSYIAGNPRLDEIRLAAILGQILAGLAHLTKEGFEHGSLTCSNILIHPYGDVKIAGLENWCTRAFNGTSQYVEALSSKL
ncbi:hypothetical protein K458DRAFT_384637 [Lentithecium fluviatile CBS 122367]|uniref:Protein kinase domain-containing protein n=1 Tax=Lentithecium fluviatile CBS 122367 TaxID=1168545 RepID=A0A6G1JD44_9PLEO|nr:hypothetical protein K458DRAFT_384637 [Lentithecium fluviatile CBS 122367]